MARERERRREFDRWPKFQMQWIRIFDQVIRLREQEGKVNEHASGQDWFDWWLEEQTQEKPVDENQLVLDNY